MKIFTELVELFANKEATSPGAVRLAFGHQRRTSAVHHISDWKLSDHSIIFARWRQLHKNCVNSNFKTTDHFFVKNLLQISYFGNL